MSSFKFHGNFSKESSWQCGSIGVIWSENVILITLLERPKSHVKETILFYSLMDILYRIKYVLWWQLQWLLSWYLATLVKHLQIIWGSGIRPSNHLQLIAKKMSTRIAFAVIVSRSEWPKHWNNFNQMFVRGSCHCNMVICHFFFE